MKKQNNIKSNFIFNSIYELSNILIPLVTYPYLSRVLHADGLGAYSLAFSVSYFFYIIIKLGLQNYGNRTIAFVKNNQADLSKTFFEIYTTQFILGIITTFIYIVYCFCFAPDKNLAIIFILLVFSGSIDMTWFLYGIEKFKITSVRDTITKIVTALCIFVFVNEPNDVWKYALIFCLGFVLDQVVVIPVIFKNITYIKPSRSGIISHIKPNVVLFLPTIAINIYRLMDKVMLGVMSNDTELGYYHSCENVVRVPLALINALGTVMLPRMSSMLSEGEKQSTIDIVFNKSILFAMFISSSICFGMMSVAKEFVPLFYGLGFDKCIDLFYVILPSCLFAAFANVIRTQFLIPRKEDMIYVISLFIGVAINLIINIILIPRMASYGAAIGTLAAEMTVCIVQAACVFKEANIGKNIVDSLPFVISGIIMFVTCNGIVISIGNSILALLVKIVISGCVYMACLGVMFLFKRTLVRKGQI